jgi:hypothetical protein
MNSEALRFIRRCRCRFFERDELLDVTAAHVTQQRRSISGCESHDIIGREFNDGCGFPQETHLVTITRTCFVC